MATEIYGIEISPKIDSLIMPDGWPVWKSTRLVAGDSFSTFRIPLMSGGPIKSLAVEVKVTGRTLQRHNGLRCVRGEKWSWDLDCGTGGDCMPGTVYGRGGVLPNGGTVLGTNDADTHVGVWNPESRHVAEYPLGRFAEIFGNRG